MTISTKRTEGFGVPRHQEPRWEQTKHCVGGEIKIITPAGASVCYHAAVVDARGEQGRLNICPIRNGMDWNMGFPVYDYRNDVKNVLITPQIRARFMKMEVGAVAPPHTHDLGHEVFLVLQGSAIFEIDGETEEVGPGQMCVALADQSHGIRVTSDVPMVMYLSVTPHIQPTHTIWADGKRLPHRFVSNSNYDVETDASATVGEIIKRHVEAAQGVADAALAAAKQQESLHQKLETAIANGDEETAKSTRDEMWDALFPTYVKAYESADIWNDLAPRAGT